MAHYGTYITTRDVLGEKATIELQTRAGTWTGSVDGTAFPSEERDAFNSGLALAIVKATPGSSGGIIVSAAADGLQGAAVVLHAAA